MTLDAYLTPYFPESEDQFEGSIVIMIDVLRASTTVCAALYNDAKEVIAVESSDKAVKIYSSLSREIRFLGGEKNSIKIDGFDAGNSPFEYTVDKVSDKTVILTTTNGTKIFQKAKNAKHKIVGAFVNFQVVVNQITNIINQEEKKPNITVLCAGTNGRMAYEDTLCAGAFIYLLKKTFPLYKLTDTADAAKNLYNLHSADMIDFLKTRQHASFLIDNNFENDVDISFKMNEFPVIPVMTGSSIKKI